MSSDQQILIDFISKTQLYSIQIVFHWLIPHPNFIQDGTDINIVNSDDGVLLDYRNLNKETKILFPSKEECGDITTICNLRSILPTITMNNSLDLDFNNLEQKEDSFLCALFLNFLIRSHISSIFEERELEHYKNQKKNNTKDIFVPEKISALEAIKAIRNKNKKKFKKNFKNWKKHVMFSQENIEDEIIDGELYSEEKKSRIGQINGDELETNEETYIKICNHNKEIFNQFTAINMIAEKINWW